MPLSPAPPLCAKCGSHRTRPVGRARTVDVGVYYRCDACEYLFVVTDEEHVPAAFRNRPSPAAVISCPRCDRALTIVGQSGHPPLVHYECHACGYMTSRPVR